jgi:hypothetical protein
MLVKFLLVDSFLIIFGMIAGAVLWSARSKPKTPDLWRPPNTFPKEAPLQRWSFTWSRCGYTAGISYFDVWSYRNWVYPPDGGMGNCTHAIRCLELGLFWWDLKLFWLAKLPPVSSGKSRSN